MGNAEEHSIHHHWGAFSKNQDCRKLYRQMTQFLQHVICKGEETEMEHQPVTKEVLTGTSNTLNVETWLNPDSIKLLNIHILL